MKKKDITDKLIIHLAQSKAYMNEHGESGLAWRLKEGKQTKEDIKCLDWAMEFLFEIK